MQAAQLVIVFAEAAFEPLARALSARLATDRLMPVPAPLHPVALNTPQALRDLLSQPQPDSFSGVGALPRFVLQYGSSGLQLLTLNAQNHLLSLAADFSSPAALLITQQQGKRSLLGRALGAASKHPPTHIVDATAGLGKDAFAMAAMGFKVTLLERSPVVAALLEAALLKAQGLNSSAMTDTPSAANNTGGIHAPEGQQPSTATIASPITARMSLVCIDAKSGLSKNLCLSSTHAQSFVDVVYLDPMFPADHKKTLSKKPMQMFEQLLGKDADADVLLPLAQTVAQKRVVVKRHQHSPFLNQQKPDLIFRGKSHRFDVYLVNRSH